MSGPRVEPPDVVRLVENYVESELSDAASYEYREPLDESGVFSLHALAARIYALGWEAGEFAEAERSRASRRRAKDMEAS